MSESPNHKFLKEVAKRQLTAEGYAVEIEKQIENRGRIDVFGLRQQEVAFVECETLERSRPLKERLLWAQISLQNVKRMILCIPDFGISEVWVTGSNGEVKILRKIHEQN